MINRRRFMKWFRNAAAAAVVAPTLAGFLPRDADKKLTVTNWPLNSIADHFIDAFRNYVEALSMQEGSSLRLITPGIDPLPGYRGGSSGRLRES